MLTQLGGHRVATVALLATLACLLAPRAYAQNPGDPLFCQPQEGVAFLIVNGGSGIFTADPDCFNNNINNDTTTSITTGQGGTLTLTKTPTAGNYAYAASPANFTGLDTFSIGVTTVWNGAGGTGSAGGSSRPGGPATLNITLNVIPATTTLTVAGVATLVPVPAGSISGCSSVGNPGLGPVAGAVYGCITRLISGTVSPAHGALSNSGNTIRYTPVSGYTGPDTFSYQALGVNNDGAIALNSGDVTVQIRVTAAPPVTPAPPTWTLVLIGIAGLGIWETRRRVTHGLSGSFS